MEFIKRNFLAVAIGNTLFVFAKFFYDNPTITRKEIFLVLGTSLIAGTLTLLDHIEKLNYPAYILLHFFGTYSGIVALNLFLFGAKTFALGPLTGSILIFYLIVWLGFLVRNFFVAKSLNKKTMKLQNQRNIVKRGK